MARTRDPILIAYRRVAVLKAIVAAERRRAEANPHDTRNIDLGIVEPDRPRKDIKGEIGALFSQLELLLDHLMMLHMAASFEMEAKARLDTVAGAARATIQGSMEQSAGLSAKLVRGADSFNGLSDIGEVLGLTAGDLTTFKTVTTARNQFSHGRPLDKIPPVAAQDARVVLTNALARIR